MGNDNFAVRVEEVCGDLGSAAKLAKKSGLSGNAIHSYIQKGKEPTRPNLIAIAKAAGVNLLWLATGEGPKYPGEVKEEKKSLEERLIELQRDFPGLKITAEVRAEEKKQAGSQVGEGENHKKIA